MSILRYSSLDNPVIRHPLVRPPVIPPNPTINPLVPQQSKFDVETILIPARQSVVEGPIVILVVVGIGLVTLVVVVVFVQIDDNVEAAILPPPTHPSSHPPPRL
jgi:hypothetical protein